MAGCCRRVLDRTGTRVKRGEARARLLQPSISAPQQSYVYALEPTTVEGRSPSPVADQPLCATRPNWPLRRDNSQFPRMASADRGTRGTRVRVSSTQISPARSPPMARPGSPCGRWAPTVHEGDVLSARQSGTFLGLGRCPPGRCALRVRHRRLAVQDVSWPPLAALVARSSSAGSMSSGACT